MTEEVENEKVYWLFKIIAICFTYIVIGFFAIFFVATSKVEALVNIDNLSHDGQQYKIGTRSGGTITEKTLNNYSSEGNPPYSYNYIDTNSQYLSIGVTYGFIQDRIYKIDYQYKGTGGTYFSSIVGFCTGSYNACNTGSQTPNATIYNSIFTNNPFVIGAFNEINDDTADATEVVGEQINAREGTIIFKATTSGNYGTLYANANSSMSRLFIYGTKITDLGTSDEVILNALNSQTQSIIDWTTAKTNQIISNDNTNTSSIISAINGQTTAINNNTNTQINNSTNSINNNANNNSQNEINNANNNAWSCSTQVEDLIDMPLGKSKAYLNDQGNFVSSNGYDVTNYVKVQGTFKIIFSENLSNDNQLSLCLYNENYQKTRCERYTPNVSGQPKQHQTIVQEGEVYARFSFDRQASVGNEYYSGTYCVNRNDNNTTVINNNINNINNNLTDSNIDDPSNSLNGLGSNFANNGVISDLLLLPVSLFQSILNSVNGSCSNFSLGTIFNHELVMPCINLNNRLGATIYGMIDILISGFFILSIRKKFVDVFEHFTSLRTGGNELE